ncbi:MAG: peptide chain release factor 1 [Chloroflexi bacterium]|nr:peptide chain release factor 1 [Chloroflexota bacterium]
MEQAVLARLREQHERRQQLEQELARPEALADRQRLQALGREHAELAEAATLYQRLEKVQHDLEETRQLARGAEDEEMQALAREDEAQLEARRQELLDQARELLRPRDPNDERDVIIEIRAGEGGEEAGLWAADLMRMYLRYAEARGFRMELMYSNETDLGGMKEVSFAVRGRGVYSRFKYESGVHRVQRIPVTEAGGRIHTSTATVAVMPEPTEVDVQVDEADLRIDVFRASGHGGQGVNTTDSAVRITHLPTGEVVTCQDGRSQLKNKAQALVVLRARLYERELQRRQEEMAGLRRAQVGRGERAEKIRTYNFRENRVTDHRIGLTLHNLPALLEGQLDPLVDALEAAAQRDVAAA